MKKKFFLDIENLDILVLQITTWLQTLNEVLIDPNPFTHLYIFFVLSGNQILTTSTHCHILPSNV